MLRISIAPVKEEVVAKIANDSILSMYEIWRGRQRPMVTFDENDDEVVHAPVPLDIHTPHWWGYYLNMAPAVNCIVIHPNGRSELHTEGGLKNLTPGKYQLYYVDMRAHSITLPDVEAFTKDAWRVRLTVDLVWQVRNPWRVWKLSSPARVLYDHCVATIVNYIQATPYEELIATPEKHPKDENRIAEEILVRLRNKRSLDGFEFVNLGIMARTGDPERHKIIKQSMNQQEEIKRAKELAVAKLETAKAEQALALQATQAQIEIDKVLAAYNLEQLKLLIPIREKLIELEQMSKSQKLTYEGNIKAWTIVSSTASEVAKVLGQIQTAPGLQSGVETKAVSELVDILKDLTVRLPNLSHLPGEKDTERKILPAVSIDHLGD